MAYALGIPTVEIYGVSRSWRWGAYWDKEIHTALDRKVDGNIDESLIEDGKYDPYTQQITPDDVFEALENLIYPKP